MNIIFAGGGTAGHVNPAIAIAQAFLKKDPKAKIAFIGRDGGAENNLVKKAGIALFTIPISGLSRSLSLKNLSKIKDAILAKKLAADIIRDLRADAVIGTGGYVCWPVISAAVKLEIPSVIHESNAAFGLTTRLLAKKCDMLLLGAKTDSSKYKNAIYTGNPLRSDFGTVTRSQARRRLCIPDGKKFILSVGGSIGAKKLNDICIETMKGYSLADRNIYHTHSCGMRYYEELKKSAPELCKDEGRCKIVPFINDMATALTAADVIISRCGAMTLAEISYCGTPAILIPSPNVTGNHQLKNALRFTSAGAAHLLEESELNFEKLQSSIREILFSSKISDSMRKKMKELCVPDSAEKIAEIIYTNILIE